MQNQLDENEEKYQSNFDPVEVSKFLHSNYNDLSDEGENIHENESDDELARSIKQRFELTHTNSVASDNTRRVLVLNDSALNDSNEETSRTNDRVSNFIHHMYNQNGLVITF